MHQDVESIMFSKEQIQARIAELAAQLDSDYAGKTPLMVGILKGSVMFYADLLRAMTIPVEMDFMAISSYGAGAKSSGEVKLIKDLDRKIEGRDVIIVEDIIDSGYTLSYLKRMLYSRKPSSVKICALLDKYSRRVVPIEADYRYKAVYSGGKARHGLCRTGERIPEAGNREGREVGAYVAVHPDAHSLEGV